MNISEFNWMRLERSQRRSHEGKICIRRRTKKNSKPRRSDKGGNTLTLLQIKWNGRIVTETTILKRKILFAHSHTAALEKIVQVERKVNDLFERWFFPRNFHTIQRWRDCAHTRCEWLSVCLVGLMCIWLLHFPMYFSTFLQSHFLLIPHWSRCFRAEALAYILHTRQQFQRNNRRTHRI